MPISPVDIELLRFVDQVPMLMSSPLLPNELKESSHIPARPFPLTPDGGFGNFENGGGCVVGLGYGSGFPDVGNVLLDFCKRGECLRASGTTL